MKTLFAKSHEWAKIDGTKAYVGISDFAQSELGDIVYIELPEEGTEVNAGDTLCEVESVKAVSEVFAPVSGVVKSVNTALDDDPSLLNQDAMGNHICVIELKEEPTGLMTEEEYKKFI